LYVRNSYQNLVFNQNLVYFL